MAWNLTHFIVLEDFEVPEGLDKIGQRILAGTLLKCTEENVQKLTLLLESESSNIRFTYLRDGNIKPIKSEYVDYLLAITNLKRRFNAFTDEHKLKRALEVEVGDMVQVPVKTTIPGECADAILRYKGKIDGNGILLGVELITHRGLGATDGVFCKKQYFKCDDNCGMFVPFDKLTFGGSSASPESVKTVLDQFRIGMRVSFINRQTDGKEQHISGVLKYLCPDESTNTTLAGIELDDYVPGLDYTGEFKGRSYFSPQPNVVILPLEYVSTLSEENTSSHTPTVVEGRGSRDQISTHSEEVQPGEKSNKTTIFDQFKSMFTFGSNKEESQITSPHTPTVVEGRGSRDQISTQTEELQPVTTIDDDSLKMISEMLKENWYLMGRKLEVNQKKLEQISRNSSLLEEKAFLMLKIWQAEKVDVIDKLGVIARICKENNKEDLCNELFQGVDDDILEVVAQEAYCKWDILAEKLNASNVIDRIRKKKRADNKACLEVLFIWRTNQPSVSDKVMFLASVLYQIGFGHAATFLTQGLDDEFLQQLSVGLASSWQAVAVDLGMTHQEIKDIENGTITDKSKQAYQAVVKWKKRQPSHVDKLGVLATALKKSGHDELASPLIGGLEDGAIHKLLVGLKRIRVHKQTLCTALNFSKSHSRYFERKFLSDFVEMKAMLLAWRAQQDHTKDKKQELITLLGKCGYTSLLRNVFPVFSEELETKVMSTRNRCASGIQAREDLVTDRNLELISVKLRGNWMKFAEHFGFKMEELSEIRRNFSQEADASLEMLKRWKAWKKDTDGFRATIDALENYDGKEIPAEILARGPDAWNIFKAAREEGEKDFNLFRLNVIGQENVGKTCLVDSILGNEFNKHHVITDAIAVTRSCMHDETDPTKWKPDDVCHDEIKGKYENALVEKIVEDLQQNGNHNVKSVTPEKKDDEMKSKYGNAVTEKINEDPQQKSNHTTPENTVNKQISRRTNRANEQQVSGIETRHEEYPQRMSKQQMARIETKMDEVIAEKVKNALKGDARCLITDDTSIRIWDFGGQPIYHNIIRFFLTPEGTFIIVFKLTDDLNAFTIIEDSNGDRRKYYMTNLEHLLFWIRSSYTYSSKSKRDYVLQLDLPACIVVGTHRNGLADTEEERERLVKEQFDQIRNAIKGKLYESHVYPTFFDVENQLGSSDKNIGKIKEVILKIKNRMKRTIPLKWFEFLIKIQELSAENLTLPLEEVKSKAKECGITDEKTIDLAIAYFSDVGEIMHHPMEEALCDTVVLQPMKLVEYVKTVFTVIKPGLRDATLQDEWRDLEKGVLRKRLLKHLWRNFQIFSDDKDEKMLNFFIALMKKFGLICQRKTPAGHGSDDSIFYAFSHIQPAFETRVMKDDQGYDKVSIFHDFCGYLPDYVFQHVVTRFIEEFLMENAANPDLAYEYIELDVDAYHRASLAVATIKHRRMFKTTILRRQISDATNVTEPEPETCKKVLTFLESVFDALCKTSTRGIQYKTCVPCGCCNNFQHMQIIDDFNQDVIPCGPNLWSITRYRRLFGDSSEATTTISHTDQCHLKDMVLLDICDALDKDWKRLGICLRLTKEELDVIESDNIQIGLKDAMMTMLVKWRNWQPSHINQIHVMNAALKRAGYVQIADELTGNTSNSGVLHDNDLLSVTDGLGTNWARFGVRLGIEWGAIQLLKAEHHSGPNACMDMLTTWKKRQSYEINQVDVMCKLLEQHGFLAVANQLRRHVHSEGFLNDADFDLISHNIGADWGKVAVKLGIEWNSVEAFRRECSHEYYYASMKMLTTWRTRQPSNINQLDVMCKVLNHPELGFNEVAEQLRTKYASS